MDAFVALDLHPAPWVDADDLKERFHRLSAVRHPDAPGGSEEEFSALNTAWQTLREPAGCLRHYLQLTAPETLNDERATPAELGDLFMEIAGLKQVAQQFLTAGDRTTSPLARALMEPQRLAIEARMNSAEARLAEAIADALAIIRVENPSSEMLAAALSRLTFLSNWHRQCAELRLRLG